MIEMMMANADEGSSVMMDELFGFDGECNDLIDLDKLFDEPLDLEQGSLEFKDFPPDDVLPGLQNSKAPVLMIDESQLFGALSPSCNSEASNSRTVHSDGFSSGNSTVQDSQTIEPSCHLTSADHSQSKSATDCLPVQGNDGLFYSHADDGSQNASSYFPDDHIKSPFDTPSHSGSFGIHEVNHVSYIREPSNLCHPNHGESLLRCDAQSQNFYHKKLMEGSNIGTSVVQLEDPSVIDGDGSSYGALHTESSSGEVTGMDPDDLFCFDTETLPFFAPQKQDFRYNSGFQSLASDDGMAHIMDEGRRHGGNFVNSMPTEDCNVISNNAGRFTGFGVTHAVGNMSSQPSPITSSILSRKMNIPVKCERNIGPLKTRASQVVGDVISRKYSDSANWSSVNSASISHNNYFPYVKNEKEDTPFEQKRNFLSLGSNGETPIKFSAAFAHHGWRPPIPHPSIKAEPNFLKMEYDVPEYNGSLVSNSSYQRVQHSSFDLTNVDDDSDVYIIEDMSAPPCPNPALMNSRAIVPSKTLTPRDQIVAAHSRIKPNDERVIYRAVLQDLSQSKSEATPPDGLMAVTLLKHQRLALSWMVNKETKSACCSGGILADDQGLGKTISTIALILKERSPSSKSTKTNKEEQTLNLDDEDDPKPLSPEPNMFLVNCNNTKNRPQLKGRPAGGTLIVCPTSVLRQWCDEIHNKVTTKANLSVLLYHGSSRTKDPVELANYDVVVTTYSIVSMEVPKQPVVNENDDRLGTTFKDLSKKRKLPETTSKKKRGKKSKEGGIDNELFENISGPLAKVGWFRVVLDEAQSIKNHRTQVARACWGLRAKRRWCLSGTPIQNSIDDLYSYFRFLRYEPYAVFRTFCEQLKAPIQKNPRDGYKKLQAVLKTIMLRRTKGTLLDGEPIINLPPKTIDLKKVDFSKEERDFYCRLEAESRAQFAEYAAAGTVKQNYVNILLMLLRLRQACDHPLLIKGFDSKLKMTSSIEAAKKLPREKQNYLLNCLEASLAICGICRDPPEDAVVTVCGHVYCNQCICQHIIGDDTQCPTKNCKTHLTMSHIFSLTTLRISLSDQENSPNCSDIVVPEPCSLSRPQDSSKIKAALEILSSLAKPQYCQSEGDFGTSDMNSDSSGVVKVVGEKAIVFSQWTRMLDLLESCLKSSNIQYRRLDGTMQVAARDRAVKDFNSLPEVSVMIMSLKAASLGLNMVVACRVLLLDLWWNPTTEDQAIDRAHRIGQTKPVSVFRLTVKDTVEDRILALQQRKREMVASAFGEDETGSRQTRLTVEDLKYLFCVD